MTTFLRHAMVEEIRKLQGSANAELAEHQARLDHAEGRLGNLVRFVADGNLSATVATSIQDYKRLVAAERAAIGAIQARTSQPIVLPSPNAILAGGLRFRQIIEDDPTEAREHLRHLFADEASP